MCTRMCAYNARCEIPLLVITGLARGSFENKDVTFHQHITHDHNMWHYLYFIVHLRTKDTTEFTGPESYVYDRITVSSETLSLSHTHNIFLQLLKFCNAAKDT